MRDAVVDREFHDLRVYHDELHFLRPIAVEDAHNQRVDTDRLTGARRTGNQEMRHLRDVCDHSLSRNVLADRETDLAVRLFEALALQEIPEIDRIVLLVRHFDADCGLAGNRRLNADIRRCETELNIIGECHDTPDLDALRGQKLIARHGRTATEVRNFDIDTEIVKGLLEFQRRCPVLEVALLPLFLAFFEKVKRRRLVLFRRRRSLRCADLSVRALLPHGCLLPRHRCPSRRYACRDTAFFRSERKGTQRLGLGNFDGARYLLVVVPVPLGSLTLFNLREFLCLFGFAQLCLRRLVCLTERDRFVICRFVIHLFFP